jgi:ATP-dependent protease ClpP protease subunit
MDLNRLKIARPVALLKQGRMDWYRIQAKAGSDTTDVYIYDEIGYWGTTAQDFVKELQDVSTSKIDLHLNSPGGDVFDGIAIYTALKEHKATVNVRIDALAASIASVIAMSGDTRSITKPGTMMIHDGWGLAVGNAQDMREMADLLDQQSDIIANIYTDRAGGSRDQWRERMKAETWYNAEEAKAAGLVDEIRGDSKDTENSWDLSIFNHPGRDQAPAPVVQPNGQDEFDFDIESIAKALEGVF